MKRLRYAPSPTGYLHIGGARTALFNYLLAQNKKGKFIVRSEDTDQKRNIKDGEKNQIENLEWLGIEIDEDVFKGGEFGSYRQTERLDIYNKYIDELLEKGLAYECWCTEKELEDEREKQLKAGIKSPRYSRKCLNRKIKNPKTKPSIRMFVPKDREFKWNDGVRGDISIFGKDVGDWVIRKSDGTPTYNFAVVIDDHLMEITDVLRGEEHISNTAKQIHLFEIFNWDVPRFFHLSIIIGSNGKKLSKRDTETLQFIHMYKERGYLPQSIFNYLSLLGWSPKSEKEIFSKDELIKIFDDRLFSKSPTTFDIEKLKWTNNFYIKKLSDKELWNFLDPFVKDVKLDNGTKMKIFKSFQSQLREGIEIIENTKLFIENYSSTKEALEFAQERIEIIQDIYDELLKCKTWKSEIIKDIILSLGKKNEVKGRNLIMPIRIATTGKMQGLDLSMVLEIFGKEKTLSRLENFLNEKIKT